MLKGFCSPLNVFLSSSYYFLFLAPWPWLPGCSAKLLKTPPSSPRLPQSLPLAGLGPGRDLGRFWRGHELSSTINSSKFEILGTHPRIPRISPDPADQVSSAAARNHPTTRAGGQDDVSSQANSLQQLMRFKPI